MKITEKDIKYIIENVLDEMAYPVSFDFNEFNDIPYFKRRVEYCEQRLRRISSGSSRIVYEVDDDKVLKLAKNAKGIAQNKMEIELGTSHYFDCFANIYEYDNNGLWVEMQKAKPARKGDFKRLLGIPFEAVCYFIDSFHENYGRPSRYGRNISYPEYKSLIDGIMESEEGSAYDLLYEIEEYMGNYQLETIGDLKRISSYGVVKSDDGERIVLIDYGLSDDIYNNYYMRK